MRSWLARRPDSGGRSFGTDMYVEKEGWKRAGAAAITARLLADSTPVEAIDAIAKAAGWSGKDIRGNLAARMQPGNDAQKKGRFGEALHAGILEEFQQMEFTSKKYRYNPAPDAPMHGVDLIGLGSIDGKEGERVVYAETKLRTTRNGDALIEAHAALVKINSEARPPSLIAEAERLSEANPDMFRRLVDAAVKNKAHYRIGAIFEESQWSDSHLDRLDRHYNSDDLDMAVDVVRINSLNDLVDESYNRVGQVA